MSPTTSQQAPLPTFLIIGAERSATRWLRFNLDRHPEVFAPPVEFNWFSDTEVMRTRGRRWYQLQFDAWGGEPVLGEASPSYLKRISRPDEVADRIHRSIPDVRLVAILRSPLDRFESAVRMYIKRGRLPADVDSLALVLRNDPVVAELDLLGAGLYAGCLYPFLQRFGDQLLVLDHDEVTREPEQVYATVLAHVGASPGFIPEDLGRIRFSDRPTVTVTQLSPAQRRLLYMAFRLDVEELEVMLDRDLTSWDPGPPSIEEADDVAAVLAAVPMVGPPPEPEDVEPPDIDDADGDVTPTATPSAVAT